MESESDAVALASRVDGGRITDARVVLSGVAPVLWRLPAVEEILKGASLDAAVAGKAGDLAVQGAEPLAENSYKVALVHNLVTEELVALGSVGAGINHGARGWGALSAAISWPPGSSGIDGSPAPGGR